MPRSQSAVEEINGDMSGVFATDDVAGEECAMRCLFMRESVSACGREAVAV